MWKSRDAFEKSTFFKRLAVQGFKEVDGLWNSLQNGVLKTKRVLRLNPLRGGSLKDFQSEGFQVGAELSAFPHVYEFDLEANAARAQHPFWGAGLAYVQDPLALEIVRDLDVQSGHWVLDLCAAPGGKSSRIAELLGERGWLVANDFDLKRARTLSNNLIRHGALRSSVFAKNGTAIAEYFPESFDRILIDAPCSGESLFFKREERRRDVYESEVQECVQSQGQLLSAAARALKPGGKIVYSTCTYNISENEEVIRKFLKAHADFELRTENRRWPHLDGNAGGFWAILQKSGISPASPAKVLRHSEAERHYILDKDAKLDLYAQAMAPAAFDLKIDEDPLFTPTEMNDWILMTEAEARAFLGGEALANPTRKAGLFRMLYRGRYALGPAKGVESRFNNLLPIEIRVQFR